MQGYFALVLHAHLPFVRHPEHERFLEESWLFEAITEVYLPLLGLLETWQREALAAPVTVTLTPPLCAMLQDALLQTRYRRHLAELIQLADKEVHRTVWDKPFHDLAVFYRARFGRLRDYYESLGGDLVGAFRKLQEAGRIEIITSAATHALLPLLASHPPSVRAQVLVARDDYRRCFGRDPRGIWLPECAYVPGLDAMLHAAGLQWFILDTHGIINADPRPAHGIFAPLLTPEGMAAFGRDRASAKQVWSRNEGYPGDPRYRDFYRDIGFDLDLDYVRPYLPAPDRRGFTGLKYYRITNRSEPKDIYDREAALEAAEEHARHFLLTRVGQIEAAVPALGRPPLVVAPYDAELFGHWWYEGPEFLDRFLRKVCREQNTFVLTTPGEYLREQPTQQVARPAASSWGEGGYFEVWLNEKNDWIHPHLQVAQERMTELANHYRDAPNTPELERALKQAARELLLAQASDWPFILRTGTSPEYARERVTGHLLRFTKLHEQLKNGAVDPGLVREFEAQDNIFPDVEWRYWGEA